MTFLAILFTLAPVLEAAACAAEGCGVACFEDVAVASDASDQPAGDCANDSCLCAVSHCCHAANLPVTTGALLAPGLVESGSPADTEPLASASLKGPERPPRA
jgi:hypothetical protein